MHSAFTQLNLDEARFEHGLVLSFGGFTLAVKSNDRGLLDGLSGYFSSNVVAEGKPLVTVYLLEDRVLDVRRTWKNWPREAGKTGLKEQISDVDDGRWVHKFKTGMVFFQHLTAPLAVGPCTRHQSQIVNFIINQHINYLQQQGGLICHAACLAVKGTGIAIGAYSGGGKSTTMLKLMALTASHFVSNDRLFLFDEDNHIEAVGVAKQPRVNPGTLMNDDAIRSVLPPDRQRALANMPTSSLWSLEEKYDVMVPEMYGTDRVVSQTPLSHVVLLNWRPGDDQIVALEKINLAERRELVAAIAKSPGPFYQNSAGEFLHAADIPSESAYLGILTKLNVWEVTGGADFEALRELIEEKLL